MSSHILTDDDREEYRQEALREQLERQWARTAALEAASHFAIGGDGLDPRDERPEPEGDDA